MLKQRLKEAMAKVVVATPSLTASMASAATGKNRGYTILIFSRQDVLRG